jgi:catechol 2,3-dioxygenase-like lactoylglutathione lyase family enzyme
MDGKLEILYVPVRDLKSALAFYRDKMGLVEAWREGDGTVAFKLPDSDVELMIDLVDEGSAETTGPMFILPSVDKFYQENQGNMEFVRKPADIPPGRLATVKDPSGNLIYFIDLSKQA